MPGRRFWSYSALKTQYLTCIYHSISFNVSAILNTGKIPEMQFVKKYTTFITMSLLYLTNNRLMVIKVVYDIDTGYSCCIVATWVPFPLSPLLTQRHMHAKDLSHLACKSNLRTTQLVLQSGRCLIRSRHAHHRVSRF